MVDLPLYAQCGFGSDDCSLWLELTIDGIAHWAYDSGSSQWYPAMVGWGLMDPDRSGRWISQDLIFLLQAQHTTASDWVSVPFRRGEWFQIMPSVAVSAGLGPVACEGIPCFPILWVDVDFSHTMRITGVKIQDSDGAFLPAGSYQIATASGAVYDADGVGLLVPEPNTSALAACGLCLLLVLRLALERRQRSGFAVLAAVLCLGALDARAASFVAASIDAPIWGGFGSSGGVGGCTFFPGLAGVPVANVSGGCAHEYMTTTGLESKITVSGSAYAEYGKLGAIASGSWTKFGAPSFTGGNWGVTSNSGVWSVAETRLEGSISNRLNYTREFGIIAKIAGSGDMFFDNPSRVVGFPWTGQVDYFLSLAGYSSGGCGGSFRVDYSNDSNNDLNNEPVVLNECSAALISTLAPGESMPFILSTGLSAKVEANSWTTNGAAWGVDYGMSADFYHTLRISSLEFLIDGEPVDPDAFGITTDAPVRFTNSGIVPFAAEVPEPRTGFMLMLGGGLLLMGSPRLRRGRLFRSSRRG